MLADARRTLVRLVIYYGLLGLTVWLVVRLFPAVPELLARFRDVAGPIGGLLGAPAPPVALTQGEWAVVTLVSMLTAIALMLPVAWVYMLTKRRGGYDQSVVQTVIMLPMTVAATVILIRNSLALAFALAAIVAAVRFRNTLEDTKDAVYIFLALAVGVAAGVVAPAVALVLSVLFNVVVLLLWAFNVGEIYEEKPFTGTVVLHAARLGPAQRAAEAQLAERIKRWKLATLAPGADGTQRLEYLVRIKDAARVAPLLDAIRAQGGADVVSAEFRPLPG